MPKLAITGRHGYIIARSKDPIIRVASRVIQGNLYVAVRPTWWWVFCMKNIRKLPIKRIDKEAMNIVLDFELKNSRQPEDVSQVGVGYDIKSTSPDKQERFIEVKGVSESWKTYNWQPLFYTEVQCLKNNPDKFFLYIVYFNKQGEELPINLFVISGKDILSSFNIKPMTFSLSPISRRKLLPHKVI